MYSNISESMLMYTSFCICMCVFSCAYACVVLCTCKLFYVCLYTCASSYTFPCMYICLCIFVYTDACFCSYVLWCSCVFLCAFVCICELCFSSLKAFLDSTDFYFLLRWLCSMEGRCLMETDDTVRILQSRPYFPSEIVLRVSSHEQL